MNTQTKLYEYRPMNFIPKIEVAAIYVNVKGKILFLELSASKQEAGFWGVLAGKLEQEESALKAAKRELFEETRLDAALDAFISHGPLYICRPDISYTYHVFSLVLDTLPSIELSSEHSSMRWVSPYEIDGLPLMKGAGQAFEFYCRQADLVDLL